MYIHTFYIPLFTLLSECFLHKRLWLLRSRKKKTDTSREAETHCMIPCNINRVCRAVSTLPVLHLLSQIKGGSRIDPPLVSPWKFRLMGWLKLKIFFFFGGGDRFEGLFLGIKNWNSVPTFVVQKAIPCSKWWCFVIFCFSLARGNGVYTGMTLGIGPSAFLFVLHQSGVGIFKTSGLLANCWYKVQIGRYVEIVRNFGV